MMFVYIKSEPFLWTVGHYRPSGKWIPESDHNNKTDAAERVSFLNGHYKEPDPPGGYGICRDTGTLAQENIDGWE